MNALIVYDSVFGNTEKVAQAIGAALGPQGNVETLPVSQVTVDQLRGLDLLIVGSPTRGFRPTEAISQLLKTLPKNQLADVSVAAFDTRIWLTTIDSSVFRLIVDKGGYAASTLANALKKKGRPAARATGRVSRHRRARAAQRGRTRTRCKMG